MKTLQEDMAESASQTAGPYVHIGLVPWAAGPEAWPPALGDDIAGPNAQGTQIRIEGCVYDGAGAPVTDAVLEIWQANATGHYAHPEGGGPVEEGFRGWGRVAADFETGRWGFDTIKPGRVPGNSVQMQAPHLNIWLIARGINVGLSTRIYFEDEGSANAVDPTLSLLENDSRRATLIAKRCDQAPPQVYRFDIYLQGDRETVFFDT